MRGSLGGLMNLDDLIVPKLMRFVYWIGLIVIVVGGVLFALLTFGGGLLSGKMGTAISSFFGSIVILICAAVGVFLWRVVFEFYLVIFNIHDTLRRIEKNLSKR